MAAEEVAEEEAVGVEAALCPWFVGVVGSSVSARNTTMSHDTHHNESWHTPQSVVARECDCTTGTHRRV